MSIEQFLSIDLALFNDLRVRTHDTCALYVRSTSAGERYIAVISRHIPTASSSLPYTTLSVITAVRKSSVKLK